MKRSIEWQIATIKAIKKETRNVKTYTLAIPNFTPHRSGQHYDLRLTAPDGYQAQRSYSIASEPERTGEIDLTVEQLENGEVSSYMHEVLMVGDEVEVRGPIGGYFVWEVRMGGPLLLVAGGSGIVPLMAMIRHRSASGACHSGEAAESGQAKIPTRLLYSSRSPEDVIYFEELMRLRAECDGLEIYHTFTRQHPPEWTGYARRIDNQMLSEVAAPLGKSALTYVCGPTLLVEAVANGLVQIGLSPQQIRTERFGPTGSNS
jgi:ferredoxin-NADP reductase